MVMNDRSSDGCSSDLLDRLVKEDKPRKCDQDSKKIRILFEGNLPVKADSQTKIDACKRVEAVILLLDAPNVPWRQVVELLNHSSVTAFLTALNIIQLIIGLAS